MKNRASILTGLLILTLTFVPIGLLLAGLAFYAEQVRTQMIGDALEEMRTEVPDEIQARMIQDFDRVNAKIPWLFARGTRERDFGVRFNALFFHAPEPSTPAVRKAETRWRAEQPPLTTRFPDSLAPYRTLRSVDDFLALAPEAITGVDFSILEEAGNYDHWDPSANHYLNRLEWNANPPPSEASASAIGEHFASLEPAPSERIPDLLLLMKLNFIRMKGADNPRNFLEMNRHLIQLVGGLGTLPSNLIIPAYFSWERSVLSRLNLSDAILFDEEDLKRLKRLLFALPAIGVPGAPKFVEHVVKTAGANAEPFCSALAESSHLLPIAAELDLDLTRNLDLLWSRQATVQCPWKDYFVKMREWIRSDSIQAFSVVSEHSLDLLAASDGMPGIENAPAPHGPLVRWALLASRHIRWVRIWIKELVFSVGVMDYTLKYKDQKGS